MLRFSASSQNQQRMELKNEFYFVNAFQSSSGLRGCRCTWVHLNTNKDNIQTYKQPMKNMWWYIIHQSQNTSNKYKHHYSFNKHTGHSSMQDIYAKIYIYKKRDINYIPGRKQNKTDLGLNSGFREKRQNCEIKMNSEKEVRFSRYKLSQNWVKNVELSQNCKM